MKYEIEWVYPGDKACCAWIAMLTGIDKSEIIEKTSDIVRWTGGKFTKVIRGLGYNCNSRFLKFDKLTEYPCLMRCHVRTRRESCWYGFVYYDGMVYCDEGVITWAEWNATYPELRVTSMLQVWI